MTEPYIPPTPTFPRLGHGLRWSELVAEMAAEAQAAAEVQPMDGTGWLHRAIEEAAS